MHRIIDSNSGDRPSEPIPDDTVTDHRLTQHLFEYISRCANPTEAFDDILPKLGNALDCDRVFLYLRSPQHNIGRVPFCWRRNDTVPLIYNEDWNPEPADLADRDPMFAAALRAEPSRFIADVETADPAIVNAAFEAEQFGHRALIHAHLCEREQLWGILQPCVFGQPRAWSDADHRLIERAVQWLTPLAIEYVNQAIEQGRVTTHHDH